MTPEVEAIGSEHEATASPLPAIVVTRHRIKGPHHRETRYRAAFRGGPHDGTAVDGCRSPENAIGELIKHVAVSLASNAEVLDFIAGLFADLSVRSREVAIARAVWIACSRRRSAPGIRIETGRAVKPDPRQNTRPAGRQRRSSSLADSEVRTRTNERRWQPPRPGC